MSDRLLVSIVRVVVVSGGLLALAGLVLATDTGHLGFWWRSYAAVGAVVAWSFGAFAWLVIEKQPRNAAVWCMAASAGFAIESAALGLVSVLYDGDPGAMLVDGWVPAESSAAVGWALVVGHALAMPGLFVPLTFGLLLFPDGRLKTRGSKVIAGIAAVGLVAASVSYGWWHNPGNASPGTTVTDVWIVVMILTALASVIDLGVRFRDSTGTARLQYKWVLWGTSIGVLVFGIFGVLPAEVAVSDLAVAVVMAATLCWVIAYGVAIGRYRLYDVDLVISRTVVYAVLAVMISVTYIVAVVGVGGRIGGSNLWLSVVVTAVIALAFEPVRRRVQLVANRLVYGRGATPHAVLADLTDRLALAEPVDELLDGLAEGLRLGTGARRTVVWVSEGDELAPVAVSASDHAGGDLAAVGAVRGPYELAGMAVAIAHQDEILGYLTVEEPDGQTMQAADRRLAQDLAGAAALVLREAQLEQALQARAADLAVSRTRLLGAQDDERRVLEQELEGTVRPQIAALSRQAADARRIAAQEGAQRIGDVLESIVEGADDGVVQIQALARGIYPQVLDTEGLAAAVETLAANSGLDVAVDVAVARRYEPMLESAVYFCVAEALTNVAKHARGPVAVRITDRDEAMTFTVTDAGPGFDPDAAARGSGLQNMQDRLDALGGSVTVSSRPGRPTTVQGSVPVVGQWSVTDRGADAAGLTAPATR